MTNQEPAITVSNLSKEFKLPHEKHSSIKSAFVNLFRKQSFERQKVLKDISFEIKKGEFFGIVGRNGSGKSTLLKLLAGIYNPAKGSITVNGKLVPFIELGVGFNPELTGRENVFLNGALLGFNRHEMLELYDEIVAFAELERFMDQKLKNYSSGMQVRLAFSIAIRAKSDVLILDEVLAVGDEAFQKKCIEVFEKYKANKKTVILVTHDMETVRRFCNRAMLIDKGVIVASGEPNKIAAAYSKMNRQHKITDPATDTKINLKMMSVNGKQKRNYSSCETMKVVIAWPDDIQGVENVGVAIIKSSGEYIYGTNTFGIKSKRNNSRATYKVDLDLGPGNYYLMAGLFGKTKHDVIEFLDRGPGFEIIDEPTDTEHGMSRLKHEWTIE